MNKTKKNPAPAFLRGRSVELRPLKLSDVDGNYARWLNDPEVCRYNSHGVFPRTREQLAAYVKGASGAGDAVVLAIVALPEGVHIGNIALQAIDWVSRSAEFAIIVGEKAFWGRGLAKEAADLIVAHGFRALGLHRIHCGTTKANVPMQRLAAHLGMKREGLRRDALFKNGEYQDMIEYGLLEKEFRARGR